MTDDTAVRYQAFDVTSADGIAHVVLKGPGKGNALGPDFWSEGPDVFGSLDGDSSVRAIVLSGAGGNFTFGLDLHSMVPALDYALARPAMAAERTRFLDQITRMQHALTSLMHCRKPVIAAVSGWCVGAGIDIICAADAHRHRGGHGEPAAAAGHRRRGRGARVGAHGRRCRRRACRGAAAGEPGARYA